MGISIVKCNGTSSKEMLVQSNLNIWKSRQWTLGIEIGIGVGMNKYIWLVTDNYIFQKL